MRILNVKPVTVRRDLLETPSGDFANITFDVRPFAFSKTMEILEASEKGDALELRRLVPPEELGVRIVGWSGEAFVEEATGAEAPCTPENVKLVADAVPNMFFVMVRAIVEGYFQATRKNLPTSPAGDTEAERGSAGAAAT